jgi:hypothetical protein
VNFKAISAIRKYYNNNLTGWNNKNEYRWKSKAKCFIARAPAWSWNWIYFWWRLFAAAQNTSKWWINVFWSSNYYQVKTLHILYNSLYIFLISFNYIMS